LGPYPQLSEGGQGGKGRGSPRVGSHPHVRNPEK